MTLLGLVRAVLEKVVAGVAVERRLEEMGMLLQTEAEGVVAPLPAAGRDSTLGETVLVLIGASERLEGQVGLAQLLLPQMLQRTDV